MKHDVGPRDAEPVPDEPASAFGVRGHDSRFVRVPAIDDANRAFVPEAPRDGRLYARRGDGTWLPTNALVPIGPTPPLNPEPGQLWWRNDPDGDLFIYYDDGVTEAWVQASPGGGGAPSPSGFRGPWQVATNVPDLTAITPEDGWTWLAQTPDHRFAEQADPTIPGIGGQTIWNGWIVEWVEAAQAYAAYDSSTLNLDDVNAIAANYVLKSGDVMTGGLTIDDDLFVTGHAANPTIPSNPEHLTNKEYVDGRITGLLTLVGVFNASTGQVTFSTASGVPNGPLPDAGPTNENWYVIVAVAGQPPIGPPETQIIQNVGDWWISDGTTWLYLPFGGASTTARNVALAPDVFGAGNVQEALEEAEAQVTQNTTDLAGKVDKAGDVMTGSLTIRSNLAILALDSAGAPANNGVVGSVANINRWVLDLGDGAPEVGAASGSNFRLGAYSDIGALLSIPLAIERATGIATFGNRVVLPLDPIDDNHAATKRYVDSVVGRVYIGSTPPPGAIPGTLWWRDDPDGDFYILYDDGSSVQWVSTTKPGLGGPGGGVTPPPFDDSHLLHLTGGTITGELLVTGPTTAPQSVVTRDWVETITSGALYQGGWRVSTNVPPLPAAPRHGDRYLCLTGNPDVPETPTGNIPGLAGRQINNGAYIIWDEPAGLWQLIQFNLGGGLTTDTADLRYLRLAGGTLTGPLNLSGAPTADLHAATKAYVDSRVLNEAGVGAWTAVAMNAQWTIGSTVQCRLINGGANIQVRGKANFNNNQAYSSQDGICFTLPATHTPGSDGGAVCPATDQTDAVHRSALQFNWHAGDRIVYAGRVYTTVASPRIASVSLLIPRT